MAKLPGLVKAMATVDGRPEKTVDHVARLIREAGYIPTTKRGIGASEMTAREAVNLLLALKGADAPKDGPLAIDRFRSLRASPAYFDSDENRLGVFESIGEAENFGVALELLIEGMPEILASVLAFIDEGYESHSRREHFKTALLNRSWNIPPIKLSVVLVRYVAEIEMATWVGASTKDAHWRREFKAVFYPDRDRFTEGFYGRSDADNFVSVTFTGRTLLALWSELNSDLETGPDLTHIA